LEEGFQQLVSLGRNFFQGETRLRLEIVEENIFFEKEFFILDLKILILFQYSEVSDCKLNKEKY